MRTPLFLALALCSASATAAPGDLDLRFADDGVMTIGNGGSDERVHALLPDAGNAVFVGGKLYEVLGAPAFDIKRAKGAATGDDMTVLRLRGDGTLDPAWGDGGYVQIGFGGDNEFVRDLVRQPDGSLVAVGPLERLAYSDFGVARFTADGQRDPGFGEFPAFQKGVTRRGAVAFNVGPDEATNDEAVAVALQSDGRVVVAGIGYAQDGNFKYPRFALARLEADGDLDPDWPGDGWFISPALGPEASEYVTAIARRRDGTLMPNDGIVVAGYSNAGSRAVLRRFLANGTPDPQFGVQGVVTLQAGAGTGLSRIDAAVLLDDGRILVAGQGNDRGFALMRFHVDGRIDGSFGANGRRLVKFSDVSDYDEPFAITLQADGKIVVAGYATSRETGTPRADFATARLTADGVLDASYGEGGKSVYPVSIEADSAFAATQTSDGSLLFAGRASIPGLITNGDMAFLRLQGDPTIFRDGFED